MRLRKPIANNKDASPPDRYDVLTSLLREYRENKGITQAALGEQLGGRGQIGVLKIEKGVRRIDPVELLAILDALDVTPTEFYKRLRHDLRSPQKRSGRLPSNGSRNE